MIGRGLETRSFILIPNPLLAARIAFVPSHRSAPCVAVQPVSGEEHPAGQDPPPPCWAALITRLCFFLSN